MTALVTLPTLVILIGTWRAANKAAIAANKQAAAAEAQVLASDAAAAVAKDQLAAAKESAQAEREHSQLMREQMLEALRPILVVTKLGGWPAVETATVVKNQSATAVAFDVVATSGNKFLDVEQSVIGPGSHALLYGEIPEGSSLADTLRITYRSADNRMFQTFFSPGDQPGTFVQRMTQINTH